MLINRIVNNKNNVKKRKKEQKEKKRMIKGKNIKLNKNRKWYKVYGIKKQKKRKTINYIIKTFINESNYLLRINNIV